jgi:hypothetical protein
MQIKPSELQLRGLPAYGRRFFAKLDPHALVRQALSIREIASSLSTCSQSFFVFCITCLWLARLFSSPPLSRL